MEQASKANLRIIGPNCLGVMNPLSGLNATFATTIAKPVKSVLSARAVPCARLCWTGAWLKMSASARSFPSARCSMSVGAI